MKMMSNSNLISHTRISPNKGNYDKNGKFIGANRLSSISKITIHHMAGNCTIETCGAMFASPTRRASSNYGVGSDGRIGLYVDEAHRSWCSSSTSNDNKAVTIEVANDGGEPNWHVSDKALSSLIDLCTDICKRNGIQILNFTGDANGNLTQHNYFAATACPGSYLKSKFSYIAEEVNKQLQKTEKPNLPDKTPPSESNDYPPVPFTVDVVVSDLNFRSKPSMDSTVNGQTGKGVFTIVQVDNGWGRLKSGAGWIWLENQTYRTIQSTIVETDTPLPYRVRVEITNLNIRKGPGINYAINGQAGSGVYTIVEESAGEGSDKGWGKLKSGAGWVSLDHVTKTT